MDLITRPFQRVIDLVRQRPDEESADHPQHTPLENQFPNSSPEMPLDPREDLPGAPKDDSRTARNPKNEGHYRTVSGTATHRHRGDHWLGRGDNLQSRLRAQTARLKRLEHDHQQLVDEHGSLEHSHRQLLEAHQAATTNLHDTQTACKKQQQENNMLRGKLRDIYELLESRNQELKVAKTFLSKEDSFSTSDVVQSIRDLNSEIMQAAAHLAENLPLKRIRAPPAEEIPEGPHKSIFVSLVLPGAPGEDADVGSLELALQGFLTLYASDIANTWCLSRLSGSYDKLYSNVRETEDRTVAHNWRALTRRTLGRMDSSNENLSFQVANGMIRQLAELISSCGVGNAVENAKDIHKHAAEKLRAVFAAARKINGMIGESIVSEDLMVMVIRGGTVFDGERMEYTYARAGVKPRQNAVICTTDVGLCEKKVGDTGASKILLKPKVVLRDL